MANYLIDLAVFVAFIYFTGILAQLQIVDSPDNIEISSGLDVVDFIILLFLYVVFMFLQEAFLKGKTIGKFITFTRAVNIDDKTISYNTALIRSLTRSIPFCFISAFTSPCNPWQDQWSDTKVIDERKKKGKSVT